MERVICGVQFNDRKISTDFMFMLDLYETIGKLAMANSVLWYCHVLRREDSHFLRRVLDFQFEGQRMKRRPKRTWKKHGCCHDFLTNYKKTEAGLQINKHAPPSLRKVMTHSSSPWFESIRDEHFIAKRERRQAERKWRNTNLTIFKDLYRQAKHNVSKLVYTAKCKFYTERIALASSSKELHQIVNTLSNRHPPKILPTIYSSADLPSIFIKHITNKVEKLRANNASEHVTSTLVTGTTVATFSSFENVSQLTVKECIPNSAPKSCELDPIPSKLLIECLDSILPSLTDLFNSSLASGIFPQCFKSALVTPILKKM